MDQMDQMTYVRTLLRQLSEVDQSPITDESMRSTSFPDYQAVLHKRMPGRSRTGRRRGKSYRRPPPTQRIQVTHGPGGSRSSPCDDHGPAEVLDRQFVCYNYSPAERKHTCYYNTTGSYDDASHDFDIIRKKFGTVTDVHPFNGAKTGISGKSVSITKDVQVEVRNGSKHIDTGHGPTSRPTLQINSPQDRTVQVRKFRYI